MGKELLKELPSVDEVLKSPFGKKWLAIYPRRYVLAAIRDVIDIYRKLILEGESPSLALEAMASEITIHIERLTSLSLIPLINATGIVVHTNLGRSVLSGRAIENLIKIAGNYSNLEYDIESGRRGKRYSHLKRILRDITGAEDGIAVNNNAAAVLLCLSTLAKGREVIVSRGELVEIGGSFRIPEVMAQSGAVLVEVGTTNKTHLSDYRRAINPNTALILKVHRSNYKISGFTEEVPMEELSTLARTHGIYTMHDLGSGCLIDLRPYGIYGEPTVSDALNAGADIVTFSGDKLLGGPQAGIIVGKKDLIEEIQKNQLLRALRIDKLTLAALEATLMQYADEDKVKDDLPTLRMLLEPPEKIRYRAKRIAYLIKRRIKEQSASVEVIEEYSQAGGGALPEVNLRSYVVAIKPTTLSPDEMEERLRRGSPPVIVRIKDERVLLDARTIRQDEINTLASCILAALS